jgi:hypothetical protein
MLMNRLLNKPPVAAPVGPIMKNTNPLINEALATGQFSPEDETLIQENMVAYKKPREVIIGALKSKGYLKGK